MEKCIMDIIPQKSDIVNVENVRAQEYVTQVDMPLHSVPLIVDGLTMGHLPIYGAISDQEYFQDQITLAEEASQKEKSRHSAVISGMQEGVIYADADNRIVEVNQFFCNFVDKKREEILGMKMEEFHTPEVRKKIQSILSSFRHTPHANPIIIQRPIANRDAILRIQPVYRDANYGGVLLNIIDVTTLCSAS
jgi:PAS domain S-box-containing protein